MTMKARTINRRRFTGVLLGAGASIAGSRLIPSARAQSQGWWLNIVTNELQVFLPAFNDQLRYRIDTGQDPSTMDWQTFGSAALSMIAIAREFGMDSHVESQYGIDPDMTWAGDWAYLEGGWDAFYSMTALPYFAFMAEFVSGWGGWRDPNDSYVWLNGTGPLSAVLLGDEGGHWAERTPWAPDFLTIKDPGDDRVMARGNLDDAYIQTCWCDSYPWYDPSSPWMARLPRGVERWPWFTLTKEQMCSFLTHATIVAGIVRGTIAATDLDKRYPPLGPASTALGLALAASAYWYCKVRL